MLITSLTKLAIRCYYDSVKFTPHPHAYVSYITVYNFPQSIIRLQKYPFWTAYYSICTSHGQYMIPILLGLYSVT